MELAEVLARRKMVRNFEERPIDSPLVEKVLAAGLRAPSAGFAQGVDLLVLSSPEARARYWEATTTPDWRETSARAAGLMRSPVIMVVVCDPGAYARRYGEPDKATSGLGTAEAWEVPYWYVDGAFCAMNLLLAAVDAGLGASFLGMFRGETELLTTFDAPSERRVVGSVLLGHPALPDPPSSSISRGRRPVSEVVHRERW